MNKNKKYAKSPNTFHWNGLKYKPSSLWGEHVDLIKGLNKAASEDVGFSHYIDHPELYHSRGKWLLVTHLYDLHVDRNEHNMTQDQVDEAREHLQDFANRFGLDMSIVDDIPSWYHPKCTMIIWQDKE